MYKGGCCCGAFPVSDLSQAKRRPALVLAELEGDDLILCQITSQGVRDNYAIDLKDEDFEMGALRQKSNVRPNRVFTADQHIILRRVGHLRREKINEITEKAIEILRQ